jgi:hypothetical protein
VLIYLTKEECDNHTGSSKSISLQSYLVKSNGSVKLCNKSNECIFRNLAENFEGVPKTVQKVRGADFSVSERAANASN